MLRGRARPGAGGFVGRALMAPLAVMGSAALAGQADEVTFEQAWYRQPLPGASVTAAYCRIANSGSAEAVVVAFEPAVLAADGVRVEMHETRRTIDADDVEMLRMRPMEVLVVPPGGVRELAPGGAHLMLFGADAARGDMVLRALFADGSEAEVRFMRRDAR